ncbi:hypothetical protein [Xanthomonas medicagonis]|uniref:hypothetical protein n=1 Tax=Xanthomonas medicagonis TaxID=3160841 RepID=UPI003513E452
MSTFTDQVNARAKLLFDVQTVAPDMQIQDADTSAEIRRRVVVSVVGEAKIKDRCDDYIHGVFDSIVQNKMKPKAQVITSPGRLSR